jgi:hypothetical protein
VLVPCHGATVIVSTADLTGKNARGRPQLAPTSGWWCPVAVAVLFLIRTLTSTAVNGRIWWTKGWKPDKPARKVYAATGSALVAQTAYKILSSEGYEFKAQGPSWISEDPVDVLREAMSRAGKFWSDPHCSACDAQITPDTEYWWRNDEPFCDVCDLAHDLAPLFTRGRAEREIEAHLGLRKLTFKRRRALIEEALARAGAQKAPNGIWVLRARKEGTA